VVTAPKENKEEDLEETVILSKMKTGAAFAAPPVLPPQKIEDEPCETVILPGKTAGQPPLSPASAPIVQDSGGDDEDDLLSETIILRPAKK
jgi:hypothetical protein